MTRSAPQSGMPATRLSFLVLLLAIPGAVVAQSASEWLERMGESMRNLAYEGTLVYEHGDDMKSMSLVHGVIDGKEHERLSALAGKPMEIIRNGDKVICIWPESRQKLTTSHEDERLPVQLPRDISDIPEMYRGEVEGESQMAGRPAVTLLIEPVDRYRYGYRLWLEKDTALLLRSDVLNPDEEVMERLMFTDLQVLEGVTLEQFDPVFGDIADFTDITRTEHEHRERGVEDPQWVIDDPPPGFMTISHNRDRTDDDGITQHSVLSDGLASVSVFIEPAEDSGFPLQGIARMGAVNAYGEQIGDHMITAVGEVPVATVQRIARSTRRADH